MIILLKQSYCWSVRITALVVCVVISASALPNRAFAQDWKFEPIIRIGAEYDDNAALNIRTDEEIESSGALLDLKTDIKYTSETTTFFIQPRVQLSEYNDDTDFSSDDYFLRSFLRHNGLVNNFGFRAAFDRQSVRTAERNISDLDIDDPDEITDDDTGQVFLAGIRNKWRVSPYWDYRLSDTSSFGIHLDHFDVQYDNTQAGSFTNYSDTRVNLGYQRKYSDVNNGFLTLTARKFDAGTLNQIEGVGALVGIGHALSEKTLVKAMVGVEQTRQPGFEPDSTAVGYVRLTRQLETIRMFAQYRRSVGATGAGTLTTRDSFNLNFRRRLSEKLTAGLGVRAYRVSGVGSSTNVVERNYVQIQASTLWYLTRSLVLELDYRYSVNDRSALIGERANSNKVNLWIIYQPRTVPKL